MANNTNIKVVTFNCYGVKNKLPVIASLCELNDVVFLQETWLLPHELDILNNVHRKFKYFSISSVDIQSHILIVDRMTACPSCGIKRWTLSAIS